MPATRQQHPMRRLLGYMRLYPGGYVLGALLTIAYAITFQLIPLSVRRLVGVLDSPSDVVAAAVRHLILVSVVFAFFRLLSRVVMFRIGRQIEFRLRNEYFDHLQRLSQSFFDRHRTGDLMSRAVNDINSVRLFLGMGLLNIIQTPVLYVGAVVVMTSIDPWLTLWVVAPYPLFIAIVRVFGRRMYQANLAGQQQLGTVSTLVQENASGVLVVRSYGLEAEEAARFEVENQRLLERMLRVGLINTTMQSTVALLPAIAAGLVVLYGGRAVTAGRLVQQDLWVFWVYIGMLTFPTVLLGFVIAIAQRGIAALQRLGEVLDTVPSIRDRADIVALERIVGAVEVRDLSFSYDARSRESDESAPDGGRAALQEISFSVGAGQTVGIVGPVGAGKSTLVSIIPRLLEVPPDKVFIDGTDTNRLPISLLRSSIAMVPQDSFLFSTTLIENIRFGDPEASLEEVRQAARRAHVLDDIEEFPLGLDTQVGERGITLSGGQRQRIALARALLLRPSILILDDSLSSVDHATEEAILGDLRGVKKDRTCFIVAHRISAVRDADLILVLENGRISERGTHRELVAAGGFYSRLHQRQRLEEEIEALGSEALGTEASSEGDAPAAGDDANGDPLDAAAREAGGVA